MSHVNFPGGAGMGRDANRRRPGFVDYGWTAENGSRAQRREALRLLRAAAQQGHRDAAAVLADLQASAQPRTSMMWLVHVPGRPPFRVICPQAATAGEIRAQWPDAIVEALDD
ncbi:MAG: hypothetical protein Q7J47_17635 [Azoarcus sp.]|nr:hypothetical protein [Azoarcus sp.]